MHWDRILTLMKIKSSEKARWTRDFTDAKCSPRKSCKFLHIQFPGRCFGLEKNVSRVFTGFTKRNCARDRSTSRAALLMEGPSEAGGPAFDLAGLDDKVGAPLFAHVVKGGNHGRPQ